MSAKVIALYNLPKYFQAFDDYCFSRNVPLAKPLPGPTKYEVSVGKDTDITGASSHHLAATLTFNSIQDIQTALVQKPNDR